MESHNKLTPAEQFVGNVTLDSRGAHVVLVLQSGLISSSFITPTTHDIKEREKGKKEEKKEKNAKKERGNK